MASDLSQEIFHRYNLFLKAVFHIPVFQRLLKEVEGTGGKVSVVDLIAFQIGWGKCLIRWYEAGIKGQLPEMPGEGFSKWNYTAIANHFYHKYAYDASIQQLEAFHEVVSQILEMTTKEEKTGDIERIGIWSWCTLSSGKKWPLSKWIRVNTVSPYKRATQLLKKLKNHDSLKNDLFLADFQSQMRKNGDFSKN
jgi:hypothetical protein